jgi:hypothetical protein
VRFNYRPNICYSFLRFCFDYKDAAEEESSDESNEEENNLERYFILFLYSFFFSGAAVSMYNSLIDLVWCMQFLSAN